LAITIDLKTMSVEEKIQAMEMIWDDLCHNANSTLSPEWHKEELDIRQSNVNAGNDTFIDWETAKRQINQTIK
jgi:putative addiction module component (TIGR02574 family)